MVNTCSEMPVLLGKTWVGRLSNSDSLAMFVAMRLVQKQQDRLAASTSCCKRQSCSPYRSYTAAAMNFFRPTLLDLTPWLTHQSENVSGSTRTRRTTCP